MKNFRHLLMIAILITTVVFGEIPTRVLLNITEDPAHEMAFNWRTYESSKNPVVEITVSNPTAEVSKDRKVHKAESEKITLDDNNTCYQHSIVIKDLKPNTTYVYRVGYDKNWSEWNHFQTACTMPKPFEFIYLGDVQNDALEMCSRTLRQAYSTAPNAKFWQYAGDISNHGTKDSEWGEIYEALGWIARVTPMSFVPGNHEYPYHKINGEKVRVLTNLWQPQFTLPENGVEGLEETNYFFNYQGVKFVNLNGTKKLEEQAKWLVDLLAKNKEKWIVVSVHQPFYSTAQGRDAKARRDLFLPIFDKYGVDLVLQGHDHAYGRTYKMFNNEVVSGDQPGTYYAVSVVGTKVYDMNEDNRKIMAKMGTGLQLYQVISVDKNTMTYKSYDTLGELFDEFVIIK